MATAATSTPAAWQPTLVCASLTSRVPREMAAEVSAAAALGADVAELQVGCLDGFEPRRDLPVLLAQLRSLPIIVTYRPKWEGGQYAGEDEPRFEALLLAMELGAEYVDIDFKVADKFMKFLSGKKPQNCKHIVSTYDYESTPSIHELLNLVAQIRATGADIVKIVTTAADIVGTSKGCLDPSTLRSTMTTLHSISVVC